MRCSGKFDEDSSAPESNSTALGLSCDWTVSRRDFVKGAGAVVGASALPATFASAQTETPKKQTLRVTINGEQKQMDIDSRTSLLDLLREDLHLTGTKKGCDHGQCGACTVLVDGRRVNSCLTLAVSCDGEQVTTIEGLAKDGNLNPMQQAFLENDGYQCGYCTPGQIISAVALVEEAKHGTASFVTANLRETGHVDLSDDEIRERMSGNICRCGAYPGIVAAVRQVLGPQSTQSAALSNANGDAHAAL